MGTLGKVAIGTAVLGGGLLAGKAGMLGTTVQRGIGTSTAWLGNKVGSQAMVKSGARTVGKSARTDAIKAAGGEEAVKNMGFAEKRAIAGKANDASREIMDTYGLPAKEAAFSDDTDADFREAALISGLGASTIGIGLMAKHGLLGKSSKKAYDKAAKKVKTIWNEAKKQDFKKEEEVVSETVKKGKSGTTSTTERITQESGKPDKIDIKTTAKKIKFSPEDWLKVNKVIKEKGMDPRNSAHRLAAAKIAGVEPVSVK